MKTFLYLILHLPQINVRNGNTSTFAKGKV